ncbi:MAG: cupin domain-containing protein [Rhodospirillaceae bacterium]|jgi:quercetin dioxygenase-like cupin family protein|nr:cupin domain-containing protein [Rhodospirillaceae bacterium]
MKSLQTGYYSTPLDRAAVAAHWQGEGYSCHSMTDRSGQEWNGFTHRTNEYVTVVTGRLRLIMAGEDIEAGPGDLVFIPKDVMHSVHAIADGETTWMFGYD